jgi:hypothetical protein
MYEFERMRSKGLRLPHMFSPDASVEELQAEYMRIRRDREIDAGVMFQQQVLMTCVSGIEFLSNNFSPVDCHLRGWSHHVSDRMDAYNDILEELYVKYKGSKSMAPELRLLMAIAGSAAMFSMQNRMASVAEQIFRGDSGQGLGGRSGGESGGAGGIGGLLSSLLGGFGASRPPPKAQQTPASAPDVDAMLRSIQQSVFERRAGNGAGDRVDIISTVSEADVPDDASTVSGNFPPMKKSATPHRRVLDLSDI